MKKLLLLCVILITQSLYAQDSLSVSKIDEIIRSYRHKKRFTTREVTEDTAIFYTYDRKSQELIYAACLSIMLNYKRGKDNFTYHFYFHKNELIKVYVTAKKRKNFSTFYFTANKLIKGERGNEMPEISEEELLTKAQSLLSKQEQYLYKLK